MSQLPLDFNPASDTSRDAAIYNFPNRERDRDRVLKALIDAGEHGATDFDIEHATGIKQTSCGKRRLELERDGLVARRLILDPATMTLIPDRRAAPSGAMAGVYVLATYSQSTTSSSTGYAQMEVHLNTGSPPIDPQVNGATIGICPTPQATP